MSISLLVRVTVVGVQAIVELVKPETPGNSTNELVEIDVLADDMEILDCIVASAVLVSTLEGSSFCCQSGQ